MKVSLITACYNSAATIKTAMESVFGQNGVEVEYIVVEGGSTDGTVEIVEEFSHKGHNEVFEFRWISERDQGMYDAINKGIKMATGDVVGILNADDMLEGEDTLAHVVGMFEPRNTQNARNEENVDCVYADVRFVKDDLNTTVRYYSAKRWKPWMLQWGKMPPHPSVYIRRGLFDKLGFYNASCSRSTGCTSWDMTSRQIMNC